MAMTPVRTDLHPANLADSFSGAAVLHSTDAPARAQILPSGIFVNAELGDVLEFIDTAGNTTAITFAAAFVGYLPFAPTELTGTTDCQVVVFWHAEP